MERSHRWAFLVLLGALAACGGNAPQPLTDSVPPASGASREGKSSDVIVPSDVDGEAIAFTVHEPPTMVEGRKYPLLLTTHGYAGTRFPAAARDVIGDYDPLFAHLLQAGYPVISIDMRGHGESGGTARAMDPEFEGRDLVQVLDWAEANLPYLAYHDGNLVAGSFGESYAGAFQLLLHRVDPQHRLDAIVPAITWHDLRYSFFGGEAFKSAFALGFNAQAVQTSTRQDPFVTQLLLGGTATNSLSDAQLAFFREHSPIAACDAGTLTPVDALFMQSAADALFNFNEGYANYQCYRALGGDVRIWEHPYGHGISADGLLPVPLPVATGVGAGSNSLLKHCGTRDDLAAVQGWFDEKLKGIPGAAQSVPEICAHLGQEGEDSIVLDAITVGGTDPIAFDAQTLLLQDGSMNESSVPLYTVAQDGEVFGGIPRATLTVLDPLLGASGLGDPVLFVGLGLQRAGVVTPLNQLSPIRGYGDFDVQLPGAFERLQAGDVIVLRLRSGSVFNYAGAGSRTPTAVLANGSLQLPLLGLAPTTR